MRLSPRLIVLMTLPPLLWAGNAVVGRLLAGEVSPLTLNLMRWVLTALSLLPFAWRRAALAVQHSHPADLSWRPHVQTEVP